MARAIAYADVCAGLPWLIEQRESETCDVQLLVGEQCCRPPVSV